MRRDHDNDLRAAGRAWRLPCLLFTLAAAGGAMAEQARPPSAEDGKYGHATTTYRVVNLGSGPLSTLPKINARGQVSFSINPGPGARGYFFNGTATQDIGTLGGIETLAIDLNERGQVAGGSTLADGSNRAFVWSAGGGMLDIGALPDARFARAAAINNRGVVTGTSWGSVLVPPQAFRWSVTDGIEGLGAFTSGVASFSSGDALNDAGLITGNSSTADSDRHVFAWTRSRGLVDIDTLDSNYSIGLAVGTRGEVAGNRVPGADVRYRAFLWTPGRGMQDLGTAGGTESFVLAMSPGAHIAGLINLADGTQRAMSWTRATGMRNLGTVGGRTSRAIEVNNKGQVVGYATNRSEAFRAFVWSARQGMVDLNSRLRYAPPGLVLEDALAINDSGAIVATSNAGLVLLRPSHGHKGAHGAAPVVGPVGMAEVVKAGQALQASVSWVDEGRVGIRSVSWSWGDGSGEQAGKVREANGAGSASASHSFAAPGIYPVKVTVLDRSGRSTAVSRDVVVAAPGSGMVAGSGALQSPQGALRKAPLYAGRASFSLVAPVTDSARAAGVPARLHFDLPGLNFRSDSLQAVGQQGAQRVFEGSGSIGGAGNYRFRLATTVGGTGGERGRFALRIWHLDPVTKKEVVEYDNAGDKPDPAAGRVVEGAIVQE